MKKLLLILLLTSLVFAQQKVGTSQNQMTVDKSGDVVVVGEVHVGNVSHAYLGFEDASETVTVTAGSWLHVTNATNNLWTLDEADAFTISGDTLTVLATADFGGIFAMSFIATNTKTYDFRCYNITQAKQEGFNFSVTASLSNVVITMPLHFELVTGDKIVFQVKGGAAAGNLTADHAGVVITYLHD